MPRPSAIRAPASTLAAPSVRRLLWPAVIAGLLVIVEVYVVALLPRGVPASPRSRNTYVAGEVAGTRTISQTFRIEAAGFDGIVMHFAPYGPAAGGVVRFELREMLPEGERSLYVTSRAAEAVLGEAFRLDVPEMAESYGRRFKLIVSMPEAVRGGGVGLLANRDDSLAGEALFVDGREQWGDLVFECLASRDTILSNLRSALPDRPAILRSVALLVLGFVACNIAFAVFAFAMLAGTAPSQSPGASRTRPTAPPAASD